MDKQQELKIKLDILKIIKDSIIPHILDDTTEISIEEISNNIEKLEAQLEILQGQYEEDELEDKDIKKITTTNVYADGKIIKTITDYKYNEEAE